MINSALNAFFFGFEGQATGPVKVKGLGLSRN